MMTSQRMTSMEYCRRIRSSDTFVLVAMCFAIFTDTFIYGMIVPILPYLLLEGGKTSENDAQKWTSILLASYGAALIIGSPFVGFISDRIRSRQAPLLIGLVTIAISTSLFLFGHSPALLVIARLCQGLSGAIIGVLGLAMIADTARPQKMGEYMAFGAISFPWGMLTGTAVGGFMFDKMGIYGAFGVPIAMLIVDIILRLLIIEKNEETEANETHIPNGADEESPLLRDQDQTKPPKTLAIKDFFHPRLMAAILIEGITAAILTAFETTLPIFTIQTYNWTSTGAGLIFLPLTLPSLLSIPMGKYIRGKGARKFVSIELIISLFPITVLRFTENNTLPCQILFVVLLALVGFFMSTAGALVASEVSDAVHEIEAKKGIKPGESSGMGTGYAFVNMAFAGGQFVGPLLAGVAKLGLGWGWMTFLLGGITCMAGLLSLSLI